jgi:hypothetical protein
MTMAKTFLAAIQNDDVDGFQVLDRLKKFGDVTVTEFSKYVGEWDALRARLAAAEQERDGLRQADAQQVDEFNAGYQAFEAGLNVDNAEVEYYSVLPAEVPHYDVFRIGYAWAKYRTIAALEKFRADILAAAALNVNVVAKMEYIHMVIDEQKGNNILDTQRRLK